MKKPILVVLAAGMGSRYGGLKQMDRIGKNGEVLLDYSVYDALRGGFEKAVFIIRRDIEADFRELVLARMEGRVNYELAFQELESLLPADIAAAAKTQGRTKPWGTAHALLCAADKLDAPFAVLNADDFYGREAFASVGAFLSAPDLEDAAIVPYRLGPTLSPQGTVARGVCEIRDGFLASVEELTAIEEKKGEIFNTGPGGELQRLAADTPVSMNFWGFPPGVLSHLRRYFDDFIAQAGRELKSECYLPKAADWFIKNGLIRIRALETASEWFGVTYREDREAAVKRLQALTAQGVYPPALWNEGAFTRRNG
jgi:choline kinase